MEASERIFAGLRRRADGGGRTRAAQAGVGRDVRLRISTTRPARGHRQGAGVWPAVRVFGTGSTRPVLVLGNNTPGFRHGVGSTDHALYSVNLEQAGN